MGGSDHHSNSITITWYRVNLVKGRSMYVHMFMGTIQVSADTQTVNITRKVHSADNKPS